MGSVLGCLPIVQPYVIPIISACCPTCAQHLWARCFPNRAIVDPMTGPSSGPKKSTVMLISRTLKIEHSEKSDVWKWEEDESETRFGEVVKALGVTFFLIEASINFARLSPETNYGAFLIFKTEAKPEGLNASLVATISVGENLITKNVCLKPSSLGRPRNVKRPDKWMEMDLGQFYCDGDTGMADISLKETTVWKKGLIIAGIEVRPV